MEKISGVLYKEEQSFPVWVYFLLFSWVLFIIPIFIINPNLQKRQEIVFAILAGILFEILLIAFIGKITVLVRWNELIVKIGFFGKMGTRLRKVEIKNVRIIDDKLWKRYGGWGIKMTFGVIAYVYSNGGGVEIELGESYYKKGMMKLMQFQKVVISSENPKRLMDAIMSMS